MSTPFEPAQALNQNGAGVNEAGDNFALSVGTGDVDGDGDIDVIAGAPGEAPGQEQKSGVFFWIRNQAINGTGDFATHQGISQETKSPFR